MSLSEEFPLADDEISSSSIEEQQESEPVQEPDDTGSLKALWAQLSDFGVAEPVSRYGTHLLAIVLFVIVL